MLDEVRRRLEVRPFAPFVMNLADGRNLVVPHPEFVWMPKPTVLFYFHQDPDGSERINPLLIVSVDTHRKRAVRKKK